MKIKNIVLSLFFALVVGGFSLMCILKPQGDYSESERRPLEKLPEITLSSVADGSFMSTFEGYATDQLPFRESLREIKAGFLINALNQKDNNSILLEEGHLSKLDNKINPVMTDNAIEKFNYIYDKYLQGMDVYFSVVPDKNCYLDTLKMDYDAFCDIFRHSLEEMTYIEIKDLLNSDSYYKTDSHWKMDKILPVAERLLEKMGQSAETEYNINTLNKPFYGVFAGQSALNVSPDEIKYLTNETIDNFTVTYFDKGYPEKGELYNMEKAEGKDPYEMFLSGSTPLCVIENPNVEEEKELILFRDSFGSSIAPILATAYSKVTVVDIRYIQSDYLGEFIEFENQDVLFLYSTMLLNNSLALR